jgi:amidase
MKNLAAMSAVELTNLLRKRQIGCLELLEFYIERYGRLNPRINAIVATDFENAKKRANAADGALARGEDWGPLHGLPMTIKDCIEVVGMPTTYGSSVLEDFMPSENPNLVQSLLDAGAVIFGKTNLSLWARDTQTFNEVYGQTNNPWDAAKTPGGSSGGAAAALAAGLTGLDIGTDVGGSIRLPAHFCGVYGHKPSYGIVSMRGGTKPWGRFAKSYVQSEYYSDMEMTVSGPLARSAGDLDLAMGVIAGPPSHQRKAIKIELPPPRRSRLEEFRVGLWLDEWPYSPDGEVGDCLQTIVDRLAETGAQLEVEKPDINLGECHRLRNDLVIMTLTMRPYEPEETFDWAVERRRLLRDDDESSQATLARAIAAYHRDWSTIDRTRAVMRQKWDDYFKSFDVLLCPVARIAAHPHNRMDPWSRLVPCNGEDEDYMDVIMSWNSLSTAADLPATAAPVGFTPAGLPVGIQIIGPYLEDRTPIQFAMLLEEQLTGSFKAPQGFE